MSADPSFVIQLPVPRPAVQARWGDYYFGLGLVRAFEAGGYKSRVQTRKHWSKQQWPNEVDIVIKGANSYTPREGNRTVYWMIHSEALSDAERKSAAHIFVAGLPAMQRLLAKNLGPSISLLPQAFDATLMYPPQQVELHKGLSFVGIARASMRPMVSYALETGTDISLWGTGWQQTDAVKYLVDERVENADLGDLYRRSLAILNDHAPRMIRAGLPSNRIFDGLACGVPVITDNVGWFPAEIVPHLYVVNNAAEFKAAVVAIEAEDANVKANRQTFAESMRDTHSFDARARVILEVLGITA